MQNNKSVQIDILHKFTGSEFNVEEMNLEHLLHEPTLAELWHEIGNIYFDQGFFKQALIAYRKAVTANDGLGNLCANFAPADTQKGDYEKSFQP